MLGAGLGHPDPWGQVSPTPIFFYLFLADIFGRYYLSLFVRIGTSWLVLSPFLFSFLLRDFLAWGLMSMLSLGVVKSHIVLSTHLHIACAREGSSLISFPVRNVGAILSRVASFSPFCLTTGILPLFRILWWSSFSFFFFFFLLTFGCNYCELYHSNLSVFLFLTKYVN